MREKNQKLGLDEIMIVNPSSSNEETIFSGEDGTLYQVQGWNQKQEPRGLGEFFLGEDGTVYQVQGIGVGGLDESAALSEEGREFGRFFLGENGMLYEIVEKK
jgi:hypothetical protein